MNLKSIILLCVFIPLLSYSQDKTDAHYYIGKTLKVNPLLDYQKGWGYENFVYKLGTSVGNEILYVIYPNANKTCSIPDSLANKVYTCVKGGDYLKDYKQYLKLKSTNNTFIYYIFSKREAPRYFTCITCEQEARDSINKIIAKVKINYLNKTVWVKNKNLDAYNEKTNETNWIKNAHLQFEPVKIVNLIYSNSSDHPYRAILKASNGKLYSVDFDEENNHIRDELYVTNPLITYKLTPSQVAAVRKGDIYLGMSKKIVTLIKGEPDDINTTTGSYGTHEQWVYGNNAYYYFENGKLTTVQN